MPKIRNTLLEGKARSWTPRQLLKMGRRDGHIWTRKRNTLGNSPALGTSWSASSYLGPVTSPTETECSFAIERPTFAWGIPASSGMVPGECAQSDSDAARSVSAADFSSREDRRILES